MVRVRTTAFILSIVLVAAGLAVIGLSALQSVRSAPTLSVEGCHLIEAEGDSAIVRALSFRCNITIAWGTQLGLGVYKLNITNIDVERTIIDSDAQILLIRVGSSSKTVEVRTTAASAIVRTHATISDSSLTFYVLGDSQGYQGGVYEVVAAANEERPDFVFHCGDMTPFGQDNQYVSFMRALDNLTLPIFLTPGNHDIRMGGASRYMDQFGPPTYAFDAGPAHITVLDTSQDNVSEEAIAWLEHDLSESVADWKLVFTHIPPFDPRPSGDHGLANATTARRLMDIFERSGVDIVFAGHIHIFNQSVRNSVRYVITGGSGADLYSADQGATYHYVNVTLSGLDAAIEPVSLQPPVIERDHVVIRGFGEAVVLSVEDLKQMQAVTGLSSFQNQYGNWRGQGVYSGVKVSDLLELVDGMTTDDLLRVSAFDGFEQRFSFWNVYPNESWHILQGDMILAFQFNDTIVPAWSEGLRLVMLAPDGAYSNDDCMTTSAPGLGYNAYPSAGAQWVRNVVLIEVVHR